MKSTPKVNITTDVEPTTKGMNDYLRVITEIVKVILKTVKYTNKQVNILKNTVKDYEINQSINPGDTPAETIESPVTNSGRQFLAQSCIMKNDISIRDIEGMNNGLK